MAKGDTSKSSVTRIKANDTGTPRSKKIVKKAKPATSSSRKAVVATAANSETRSRNPFGPIVRYIKGAWYELRQVRWPDRRSTWGMTGALIAFTVFFVIVILLLDAGFQQLFKLMIGK